MGYYYGTEHKEEFEQLFGKYYIGKNPTAWANQYQVLIFEFSQIDTKNPESTFEGFLEKPIKMRALRKTIAGNISEKQPLKPKEYVHLNYGK